MTEKVHLSVLTYYHLSLHPAIPKERDQMLSLLGDGLLLRGKFGLEGCRNFENTDDSYSNMMLQNSSIAVTYRQTLNWQKCCLSCKKREGLFIVCGRGRVANGGLDYWVRDVMDNGETSVRQQEPQNFVGHVSLERFSWMAVMWSEFLTSLICG